MARVVEVFKSIQGEGLLIGKPCVFVRFAGCNLRCRYCDTKYAWVGGTEMSPGEIASRVREHGLRCVTFTGGEPMLWWRDIADVSRLLGREVLKAIETNGQITDGLVELAGLVDVWAVSPKTPTMNPDYDYTRFAEFMDILMGAKPWQVYVKIPVGSEQDVRFVAWLYDSLLFRYVDADRVVLQPLDGSGITYPELAGIVLRLGLDFRVLPQLHKVYGLK